MATKKIKSLFWLKKERKLAFKAIKRKKWETPDSKKIGLTWEEKLTFQPSCSFFGKLPWDFDKEIISFLNIVKTCDQTLNFNY